MGGGGGENIITTQLPRPPLLFFGPSILPQVTLEFQFFVNLVLVLI